MKVAIYLRVSTDLQDSQRQLTELKERAKQVGDEIAYEFPDYLSGYEDENRPELNKLLKLTKEDIDIIYVHEVSRLSRNPTFLRQLVDIFTDKGINIYFYSQNIYAFDRKGTRTFATNLMIMLFSEFSDYETKLKNIRTLGGKREAIISKGKSYAYKAPFGYSNIEKILTFEPKEDQIVKEIFNRYVKGTSTKEIIDWLNFEKIPTKNQTFLKKENLVLKGGRNIPVSELRWTKGTILSMLRNTTYAGYTTLQDGTRINTPAIISEKIFADCQAQITGRSTSQNKTRKHTYLLRGVLQCGECGNYYVAAPTHHRFSYKCSDRKHRDRNSHMDCRNASIDRTLVEEMIWDCIKGAYNDFKNQQINEANKVKLTATIDQLENTLAKTLDNIDGLKEQNSRLLKQYMQEFVEEGEFQKQTKQLKKDIEILVRQSNKVQSELNDNKSILDSIQSEIKKTFNLSEADNDPELKKEAIRELIGTIIIKKIDTKYILFTINFKSGISSHIIRQTWTKKYYWVGSDIYSFDPETLLFTNNYASLINDQTEFVVSNAVITYTPIELFNELKRQAEIEESSEYAEMVEEFDIKQSNLLKQIEDADQVDQ